jgi:RNA polymerase sigma-70 factor (ECF subfamily)
LLARVQAGDRKALEAFGARYRRPLLLWAHGRLPRWARDRFETEDIVQEVLFGAVRNLGHFEYDGPGAIESYLRGAVANRVRDEIRRVHRRPAAGSLDESLVDDAPSPLEAVLGREALERFDAALAALDPETRSMIIARVELGMSYRDIASGFGKPSVDAARMAIGRALVRLAEEMARRG